MKASVSKTLVSLYADTRKNYNYSLDVLLSSLDTTACTSNMDLLEVFQLSGEQKEIEIDDSNIDTIKSIFGSVDAQLIERLLWVAAMFPEI